MLFTWDPGKASANRRKHGVSFDEATTVFADPLGRILPDPDHSVDERREVVVGRSTRGRLLLVGFTERAEGVRLIFESTLTRVETRDYEEHQ